MADHSSTTGPTRGSRERLEQTAARLTSALQREPSEVELAVLRLKRTCDNWTRDVSVTNSQQWKLIGGLFFCFALVALYFFIESIDFDLGLEETYAVDQAQPRPEEPSEARLEQFAGILFGKDNTGKDVPFPMKIPQDKMTSNRWVMQSVNDHANVKTWLKHKEEEEVMDEQELAPIRGRCRPALAGLLSLRKQSPGKPFNVGFLHFTKAGGSTMGFFIKQARQAAGGAILQGSGESEARQASYVKKRFPFGQSATMLRDPLSRYASFINFRRFDSSKFAREEARGGLQTMATFSEYYTGILLDARPEVWRSELFTPKRKYMKCTQAVRKLVMDYPIIGITEHLFESAMMMAYLLQWPWPPPAITRVNAQIGAPGKAVLPAALQLAFPKLNRCDSRVYRAAKEIFESDLKCLGKDFQDYLEKAKRLGLKGTGRCDMMCVPYGQYHRAGRLCSRDPKEVRGEESLVGMLHQRC